MKQILIVKTSSLGDVVHNLPAVTDIRRAFPDAAVDWLVEQPYAQLVALHPGVRRAIPVSVRRWRRQLLRSSTWREVSASRRALRLEAYDAVIDTQGLFKSALLATGARGVRHGFDRASAREAIACTLYHRVHGVDRNLHAVERNRLLVSAVLGTAAHLPVDYGIGRGAGAPGARDVIFLHSTSRADKHWPERDWIALGRWLASRGTRVVLPWGSGDERARSERLAQALPNAVVPGALQIDALARLLAESAAVVGVDTGLTHLAAALGVPVAAIFCATDARLTGVYGAERAWNIGSRDRAPSAEEVVSVLSGVVGA